MGLSSSTLLPKGIRNLSPSNAFKNPGTNSLTMSINFCRTVMRVFFVAFVAFSALSGYNFSLPNSLPCAEVLNRAGEVQGMLRCGLQHRLCCNRDNLDLYFYIVHPALLYRQYKKLLCMFWGWQFYRRKLGKDK